MSIEGNLWKRIRRPWFFAIILIAAHSGIVFLALAIAPSETIELEAESRFVQVIWYPHFKVLYETSAEQSYMDFVRQFHGRAEVFLCALNRVKLSDKPFPDQPPLGFPDAEEWDAIMSRSAARHQQAGNKTSPD